MKNILSALAALFLIFSSAQGLAEEKEDFSQLAYHPAPVGRFDFEQDPFFSMIVQELKVMIIRFRDDEEHGIDRLKRWNHFCAVGYVFPERPVAKGDIRMEKEVAVYWQEEGAFIFWGGDDPEAVKENFYYAQSLYATRSFLMENAVDRKYLEQPFYSLGTGQLIREDLENIIADCKKHGRQYIIGPFTPPFEEH